MGIAQVIREGGLEAAIQVFMGYLRHIFDLLTTKWTLVVIFSIVFIFFLRNWHQENFARRDRLKQ